MKQRSRRYQSADICIVWAGKYVLKFWQESLTFQKEEHTALLFSVYQIIRAEFKKKHVNANLETVSGVEHT